MSSREVGFSADEMQGIVVVATDRSAELAERQLMPCLKRRPFAGVLGTPGVMDVETYLTNVGLRILDIQESKRD